MLYLGILVFFLSYVQNIIIDQELPSLLKSRGRLSTARITCQIQQKSSTYIHWYVQKQTKIERILYFNQGKITYEDKFNTNKYECTEALDKYTLLINGLTDEDSGIYYCANWAMETSVTQIQISFMCFCKVILHSVYYKVFGSGTKLIVTDEKAKEPDVTILASRKSYVKTKKSATLLCNLQNFFPDVIDVSWTVAESNTELESAQGEIITNPYSKKSSLHSWISIQENDIGNIYKCRYKHEGKAWVEVEYKTEYLKDHKWTDGNNCTYISDDVGEKPRILRTAQLIYALLLLKGFMYCPLLLFFNYKASE
ncbi:immunoglobulin kappa light chain-like [Dendropsophus ebraccatus]|uniref:immunoglobulin kappa light chain-like n=1 Tax=Dendropsophus ebraccatus TaxID=150705 RepID=UPI0038321CDC